jgi:prophage antirepressor-like protein
MIEKLKATSIQLFDFHGRDIRITDQEGNPWFVFTDLCEILGYKNPSKTAQMIREKYKSNIELGSGSPAIIVNEAGLNQLIMRSNKAEAEKFQDFVYEEVLPSIRKTGQYIAQPPLPTHGYLAFLRDARDFLDEMGMLDDRDKLALADAARTKVRQVAGLLPEHASPSGFDLADRVSLLGYKLSQKQWAAFRVKLGKRVADEYRSRHNEEPPTTQRYIDGKLRPVKWYPDEEASWVDTVIQTFFAGFPGVEMQQEAQL